jgi:hypothetical protein
VDRRYRVYQDRLTRLHDTLAARLEAQAPDLRAKLEPVPPVAPGYRILPKLVPDPPPHTGPARIISSSYSWRRTEGLVERDESRLEKADAEVTRTGALPAADRRAGYEKLVADYKELVAGQKRIASHIAYNRLWQEEIARNPGAYDRLTALHDAVLERQALLSGPPGDEVAAANAQPQVEALSRRIDQALRKFPTPGFVQVSHPAPHRWTITMRIYTDIEDQPFLDRIHAAVESHWHVRDGEDEFAMALDLRRVELARLYPGGDVPVPGAPIDLGQHQGRFPPDGAVLTTGAGTLHVLGRAINLAPHDLAPRVLAHEFGHLLGFVDGYFRGYRDRGADGYEVLEVIIDPGDIMSAPGAGSVRRQHFEEILRP